MPGIAAETRRLDRFYKDNKHLECDDLHTWILDDAGNGELAFINKLTYDDIKLSGNTVREEAQSGRTTILGLRLDDNLSKSYDILDDMETGHRRYRDDTIEIDERNEVLLDRKVIVSLMNEFMHDHFLSRYCIRFETLSENTFSSLLKKLNLMQIPYKHLTENIVAYIKDDRIAVISDKKFILANNRVFFRMSLKELDLTNVDSSRTISMKGMFKNSHINTVILNGINTSKVEDMTSMFAHACIYDIDLSILNTRNVKTMSNMFKQSSINNNSRVLDLSSFNTRNVRSMTAMFADAIFNKIKLDNFDTTNVSSMRYMFRLSEIYEPLDLSHFKTNSILNIQEMFLGAKVKEVDFTGANIKSVADVTKIFRVTDDSCKVTVSRNIFNSQQLFRYIQDTVNYKD